MSIIVVSWNILRGEQYDKILQTLRSLNADVIGLQEVAIWKDDRGDIGKKLAQDLGLNYASCKALDGSSLNKPYDLHNGILSRFEIKNTVCHQLSPPDLYEGNWMTEPRTAISAAIIAAETELQVINTHIYYPRDEGQSAVSEMHFKNLGMILPKERTVLMGDFNAQMTAGPMKKLGEVLHNVDLKQTETTFTDRQGKKLRLDHIFISNNLKVEQFEVIHAEGSDHLPIKVTIPL